MAKIVDVLIVGGGPVGLSMAAMLTREGVSVRIIDRSSQPTPHSKAMGIQSKTIEILEHLGIAGPFLARAHRIIGTYVYVGSHHVLSLTMDPAQLPESAYPYGLMLPQSVTEELLLKHLADTHQVHVERNIRFERFQEGLEHVEAIVTDQDGHEERIAARYLIACDGARSTIRKQLNIPFKGVTYDEQFVLADVLIDWDVSRERVHSWMHKEGMLVALPLPEPRRWRIFASYSPDTAQNAGDEAPPSLALIERTFRERTGGCMNRLSDPIWLSSFRINRRLIARYRHNRILLAGDAAHIHSPIGGQGMNTGIQDAYNLAWKLALVIKGSADAKLLDTYEEERQPVAKSVLKRTGSNTRLLMAHNPLVRIFRDRVVVPRIHSAAMQAKMMGEQTNLTVSYRGCSLAVDRRNRHGRQLQAGDRLPDIVLLDGERLYARLAAHSFTLLLFAGSETDSGIRMMEQSIRGSYMEAALSIRRIVPSGSLASQMPASGCILVRPDRYIGYISVRFEPQDLKSYMDQYFRS
jgi:2-polyprenyl-6-methoxyphenol hydroxylase-like FAD-dependent oxidoreductase